MFVKIYIFLGFLKLTVNNIIKGGYTINGYKNEYEIITYLNGKYLKEIHPIFRELLEKLYPSISEKDIIFAKKYGRYAKCDMVIEVNGIVPLMISFQ